MEFQNVASLLQLGFSGFAAVMAILSYRLIKLEMARTNPDIKVIKSLQTYTKYTLYLSVAVMASSIIDKTFNVIDTSLKNDALNDNRHMVMINKEAQDCRESLSGIMLETANRPPERVQEAIRLMYTKCLTVMSELEETK